MMFLMGCLEQYPFQLLTAALLFGRRLNKKRFWGAKAVMFALPLMIVYELGITKKLSAGNLFFDRAVLLIPVVYTMFVVWFCYECKLVDSLYYTVTAAAAQNLVFNSYWIVITYLGIHEGTVYSVMVSIPIMILIYMVIYRLFSGKLREWVEYSFIKTKLLSVAAIVLVFIVFLNQRVGAFPQQYLVYGAYILGDIFCLLLLFGIFYESGLEQKYLIMEQLLYAEQKKQQMTKESVELINRKCHDLKHQIGVLRMMGDSKEKEEYIKEIEKAAMFYESSAKTGSQMLDLLLMEKLLYCEKHRIKLSCIAEGDKLDFLDAMDLYSVFGNALDNAIESVVQEEDEKKRIISFKVVSHGQILSIHFENYIGHELEFVDGMPLTTKKDKQYHGFGMMSIRYIVEKYGGTLQVSSNNNIFYLNILLPIPDKE